MFKLFRKLMNKYYYTDARLTPQMTPYGVMIKEALDRENDSLPYGLLKFVEHVATSECYADKIMVGRAMQAYKDRNAEADMLRRQGELLQAMANNWGRNPKPNPQSKDSWNSMIVAGFGLDATQGFITREGIKSLQEMYDFGSRVDALRHQQCNPFQNPNIKISDGS